MSSLLRYPATFDFPSTALLPSILSSFPSFASQIRSIDHTSRHLRPAFVCRSTLRAVPFPFLSVCLGFLVSGLGLGLTMCFARLRQVEGKNLARSLITLPFPTLPYLPTYLSPVNHTSRFAFVAGDFSSAVVLPYLQLTYFTFTIQCTISTSFTFTIQHLQNGICNGCTR